MPIFTGLIQPEITINPYCCPLACTQPTHLNLTLTSPPQPYASPITSLLHLRLSTFPLAGKSS